MTSCTVEIVDGYVDGKEELKDIAREGGGATQTHARTVQPKLALDLAEHSTFGKFELCVNTFSSLLLDGALHASSTGLCGVRTCEMGGRTDENDVI